MLTELYPRKISVTDSSSCLSASIRMASQHQMRRTLAAVLLVLAVGSGCASSRQASIQPMSYRQQTTRSQPVREWNDWADTYLQNGDIVFMRGDCYMLLGTVNFSELSTDLTDSRFSHIGMVAVEDGEAYVYDIRNKGCLRTRFGELLAHRQLHQVAIKRHREASAESLVQAAAYCRNVFQRREKYDDQLKLDNDRLYCTELVVNAYEQAGFSLSEPVAIQDLPNYERHVTAIQFVGAVTTIEPDQLVLLPGNEQFGVWASPQLDLILDLPDTKVRPKRH